MEENKKEIEYTWSDTTAESLKYSTTGYPFEELKFDSSSSDDPVVVFNYRGYTVPIYMDEPGQQFYCTLDGEELGFGAFNTNYADDLEYLIDERLDVIHRFDEPYWGARLEWFNNYGFRDIRLLYRLRELKIFLTSENFTLDEQTKDKLIKDSEEILKRIVKVKKD